MGVDRAGEREIVRGFDQWRSRVPAGVGFTGEGYLGSVRFRVRGFVEIGNFGKGGG